MPRSRSKKTLTNTFIGVLFFWNILLTVNWFTRSDDQLKDQLNNHNARLYYLESHSAKQDKNISGLFKNDSLIVIRDPAYQASENKRGFLNFLYRTL